MMTQKHETKYKKNDCVQTHFRHAEADKQPPSDNKKQSNAKAIQSLQDIERKIGEVSGELSSLQEKHATSIKSVNFVKQHIVGLDKEKEKNTTPKPTTLNAVLPQIKEFLEKQKKTYTSRVSLDISASELQKIGNNISHLINSDSEKSLTEYQLLLQNFKRESDEAILASPKVEKKIEAPKSKTFYNEPTRKIELPSNAKLMAQPKELITNSAKKSLDELVDENASLKEKMRLLEREKEALRNEIVKLSVNLLFRPNRDISNPCKERI